MKLRHSGIVCILLVLISLSFGETITVPLLYFQRATGENKITTSENSRGVAIAVDKINHRGGLLGKKVMIQEFVVSEMDYALMQQTLNEILEVEGLFAMIGANNSSLSIYVAPYMQAEGVVMISPVSTNPLVTEIGDYIYRVCYTDDFQGKVAAKFALNELNARTAIVLTNTSSQFSMGLSEVFIQEFEAEGAVLSIETYTQETVDFTETLERVKRIHPDIIFLPGHAADTSIIMKQAHYMNIETVFIGGDGWGKGILQIAGPEVVDGNFCVDHWHRDVETELSREFTNEYIKRYNEESASASAALSYDALMLLASAVEKCGSFSPEKIKYELDHMEDFEGVAGVVDLTHGRDPFNKSAVIVKYKNGNIVYHTTVTP